MNKLRNKKKPILGVVAGAVAYLVCRLLFDMSEEASLAASATVSAFVVERVGPIFGEDVGTPKLETNPHNRQTEVVLPMPPASEAPGPVVITTESRSGRKRRQKVV